MNWMAKVTGDMTLSIMDENDFQVLKVDMLRARTMEAGTDGDLLIRTLNDLQVIANFSQGDYDISDDHLKYPGGGISALPWAVHYDSQKRRIAVKSINNKIADRSYPKSVSEGTITEIYTCISNGIQIINSQHSKGRGEK